MRGLCLQMVHRRLAVFAAGWCVWIVMMSAGVAVAGEVAPPLTAEDVQRMEASNVATWDMVRSFAIKPGQTFVAKYSFTRDGHGVLRLGPALWVKVYDTRAEGGTYAGGLLTSEVVDVNGDGFADLVLSGVQEGGDTAIGSMPMNRAVVGIFIYRPNSGDYVCIHRSANLRTYGLSDAPMRDSR